MKERIKNWLKAIFRFVFAIVFTPIRWLENLLTSHKDNLLEWHFNYGPYFIHLKTKRKEQFSSR